MNKIQVHETGEKISYFSTTNSWIWIPVWRAFSCKLNRSLSPSFKLVTGSGLAPFSSEQMHTVYHVLEILSHFHMIHIMCNLTLEDFIWGDYGIETNLQGQQGRPFPHFVATHYAFGRLGLPQQEAKVGIQFSHAQPRQSESAPLRQPPVLDCQYGAQTGMRCGHQP